MLNLARWAHNIINEKQSAMIGISGGYMIIKRYSGSDIDDITGDPIDPTSRACTQYRVPILLSETEDYRSRVDEDHTNLLVKDIRITMSAEDRIIPRDSDEFVVSYGGNTATYRARAMKFIGSRIQIDLTEIDQK